MALLLSLVTQCSLAHDHSRDDPLRAPSALNQTWTEIPWTSCDGAKIKDLGNVTLVLAKAKCSQNFACGCITVHMSSGKFALYMGAAVVSSLYHHDSYIRLSPSPPPNQAPAT